MVFSYTIVSFIIIGMMFTLLIYVGNTVVSYITITNKLSNPVKERHASLMHTLIIQSANYSNGYIFFNLTNLGPTSQIIDSSSTLILEYISGHTLGRMIEVMKFGESWVIEGYFIANKYSIYSGNFIELRPGTTILIKVIPSEIPSLNDPILIVLVTKQGMRAEYVFTHS